MSVRVAGLTGVLAAAAVLFGGLPVTAQEEPRPGVIRYYPLPTAHPVRLDGSVRLIKPNAVPKSIHCITTVDDLQEEFKKQPAIVGRIGEVERQIVGKVRQSAQDRFGVAPRFDREPPFSDERRIELRNKGYQIRGKEEVPVETAKGGAAETATSTVVCREEYAKDEDAGLIGMRVVLTAKPEMTSRGELLLHMNPSPAIEVIEQGIPSDVPADFKQRMIVEAKIKVQGEVNRIVQELNGRRWRLSSKDKEQFASGETTQIKKSIPFKFEGHPSRMHVNIFGSVKKGADDDGDF